MAVVFITGCASKPEIKYVTKEVPMAAPIPVIEPVSTKPLEWEVTSNTNGDFKYSLSQESFDNLIYNLEEMRRYILDQKSTIQYLGNFVNAEPLPNTGNTK